MKIFVRMMKHLIIIKNSISCNCADGLSFWLFWELGTHLLCYYYYCLYHLGNPVLHWTFDTLDNSVLMEENLQRNFSALIPGKVEIYFAYISQQK